MKKVSLFLMTSALVLFFAGSSIAQNKKETTYTTGLEIGNKAPELKGKTTEDKELALTSLKGKMVLIDFWASWCGPCRRENPSVVKAYKTYKDKKFKNGKGFTVFSVSLDKSKQDWINAISKDGLEWQNHICDFGYWESALGKSYKVNSIPSSWLIDGEGVIIGKNLKGEALMQTLEGLLKK